MLTHFHEQDAAERQAMAEDAMALAEERHNEVMQQKLHVLGEIKAESLEAKTQADYEKGKAQFAAELRKEHEEAVMASKLER